MNSSLFKLDLKDFIKGAVVSVLSAVVITLAEVLKSPGFDFATFDWSTLLAVAGSSFVAYLAKNFLSNEEGKVLGKIG